MMTDIPFGIAEIEGESVAVAELTFPEVTALISFLPNHQLVFDMVRNLDFTGDMSPVTGTSEEEIELLINVMQSGYSPSESELETASHVFAKWISTIAPIGLSSLSEKGLLLGEDGAYKTHRSLDSILRILRNAIEHMSYKTSQVRVDDPESKPILRSSLYAVQGFVGDWLIAEHFQSHEHIRFFCIPSGGSLASRVGDILYEGVKHSTGSHLISRTGIEYRPFSVFLARTNEHGAHMLAGSQSDFTNGKSEWYAPYTPTGYSPLLGDFEEKFGNPFATDPRVAEMTVLAYNQLDIRNGLDDWSYVGGTQDLLGEVKKITRMTLHSQADHLPDTIPDFFFEN